MSVRIAEEVQGLSREGPMIYVVIGLIVLVVVLGMAAWWLYSMIAGGADAVSEVLRKVRK